MSRRPRFHPLPARRRTRQMLPALALGPVRVPARTQAPRLLAAAVQMPDPAVVAILATTPRQQARVTPMVAMVAALRAVEVLGGGAPRRSCRLAAAAAVVVVAAAAVPQ